MTHSIVAADRSSGLIGLAVATCMPAVGASVPWARAGVGAVATQATVDPRYGATGLDLLAAGAAPADVLAQLRADDPAAEHRQVALVDAAGRTAAFTGDACFGCCGHLTGDGYVTAGMQVATAIPIRPDERSTATTECVISRTSPSPVVEVPRERAS